MVDWTCPTCGQAMHSAWDSRDQKTVQCIHCDNYFINPYYEEDTKLVAVG